MGNNPPHMGLSSLSGICLMFKNCLNLMETIISDWGRWNSRASAVSKIRSEARPPRPLPPTRAKATVICQILTGRRSKSRKLTKGLFQIDPAGISD